MYESSLSPSGLVSSSKTMSAATTDVSQKVAEESHLLYQTKTMFPFELFPTIISVDKTKVSVISTIFFGSKEIKSLPIKDIFTVTVDVGPLFARISIIDRMARQAPVVIEKLPVDAALKLRRLIQGLVIASNNQLDVNELSHSDQLKQLEELGSTGA